MAMLPATPTGRYEEDLAVFLAYEDAEQADLWGKAAWAAAMAAHYGRATARLLAADSGHSAYYVRSLIATAKAFPTPADRAADLSFSHHRIAAETADPAGWIDQAVAHQWSVAELRAAIRAARDPVADSVQAEQARRRLDRAVAAYNARWAAVAGCRLALVEEPVAVAAAAS